MRLQQQKGKQQHKSRDEVAALIQYPLLGFSLPSPVNPIEYLTKYSTGTAPSPSAGSTAGSAVPLPARSERRNAARKTNRQLLRDRIKILGVEAVLEELEQKKKRKSAPKGAGSTKNNHGSCKGECNAEEELEDQKAEHDEEEEGNNSASAKVLHKVESVVASPFRSDEGRFFSNSSEDADVSEFEGNLEDFDEEKAPNVAAFPKNEEKDDDDEDVEEASSGSAGFNKKSASAKGTKAKTNDSKDDGAENEQEDETGAATTASQHKGKGILAL
ncbi:hypothetical protein, conserved [Eimeria brunetti]|uniref:Uncharacterized protein n=1 Tax=Eimeria brunetti TaxID=51314 RepID=U6LHJ4_9EIME|nr:hypothetical protein, conserved [Eimeria brunetti]